MWIEKLNNGRYRYADRYKDLRTGKLKKISIVLDGRSARVQRLASSELNRMIRERQSEITSKADAEMTLGALAEKYKAYQSKTVKQSTARRNAYACDTLCKLLGSDTIVSKLSAKYIKNKFINSGRSNSTLNEDRRRLFAMLRWGFDNDYVADVTYLRKIKPFKAEMRHKDKIEDKFLEREELAELIDNISLDHWKRLTEFLALSGLRFGEAAALTESDININGRTINVDKTYDYINKTTTTPKTAASARIIHMQDELCALCKSIRANNKAAKRIGGFETDLYFFNADTGLNLELPAYNKALRHASKHMCKHVTAHVLRHTHTSLLAESGMSVDAIARRLGHENSKITRDIYLHVTKRQQYRENKQLDSINLL